MLVLEAERVLPQSASCDREVLAPEAERHRLARRFGELTAACEALAHVLGDRSPPREVQRVHAARQLADRACHNLAV